MRAEVIVIIIRAILCEKTLRAWLEKQAQATDSPLDNIAVKTIYMLLSCEDKE